MIDYLKQEIKFLPGVGPKRAELLNKECSIFTFEDLLYYFPFKYVDRTQFYTIRDIRPNLPYIQVKGKIMGFKTAGEGSKQRLIADFTDGTGTIELVWFKGTKWIRQNYKPGIVYIIFGKPSAFGGTINIIHPEIEVAAAQE
ncbi:MAG: OB-fold nucleic acid binding domain-containing protein, partial [Bacteroidota bacterium]|nr:OB-fold nucleic acid binding domain-containing protein [Bacteroidota bacterium]